jgi:hypothetical protein
VIEKLLAALVLIVCLVMLGRMMLPARQQQRFDARLRSLRNRRPWQRRAARQDAARTAEEAIRKARRAASRRPNGHGGHDADKAEPEGEWDGNVFRPKSFKPPQKPH